ncbi:MAG: glycoside hydrolase family 76 protein [Clostridia bacterium]|nr:glycoside hydrolase family 76 protein [Clostridia bacterium]
MKKLIILLTALLVLLSAFCLTACDTSSETTAEPSDTTAPATTTAPTTEGEDVSGDYHISLQDGTSSFVTIYPMGANRKQDTGKIFTTALTALRKAFKTCGYVGTYPIKDDLESEKTYEILLGATNREASTIADTLEYGEAVIRTVGNKIIIVGYDDRATASAIHQFVAKYMSSGAGTVKIPKNLDEKVEIDLSISVETGMSYYDMAMEVWNSFNTKYWKNRWVQGTGWWDAAEVLETYIDAYEATKDADIKNKMLQYATTFRQRNQADWTYNEYNDDITWAVIAYTRIYLLTGETSYLTIAKNNFDKMYARAWDEKLGGGLYWRNDNQTKNACINCPAAIAACYLAEATKDESYYTKAIEVMDWVFENLYQSSGAIIDSYNLQGEKNTWASTYNQGTFIGACNLLYQKTGEKDYYDKAYKAAEYAMAHLTSDGILNGEGNPSPDNKDLPGFKGILTRWLYRFAKDNNDYEILLFLQANAAAAYQNRNASGLIWTEWKNKTPDVTLESDGYYVFGMSTAVALMFNSIPWN